MVLLAMSPAVAQAPLPQTSTDIQVAWSSSSSGTPCRSLTDIERAERLTSRAYTELHGALSTMIISA